MNGNEETARESEEDPNQNVDENAGASGDAGDINELNVAEATDED